MDAKSSSASSPYTGVQHKQHSATQIQFAQKKYTHHINVTSSSCALCPKQPHVLRLCKKFLNLSVADRFSTVKKHNYCLSCLTKNHSVKDCKSNFSCTTCKGRHHTLLHRNVSPNSGQNNSPNNDAPSSSSSLPGTSAQAFHSHIQSTSSKNSSSLIQSCHTSNLSSVLLGTATVHICHLGSTYSARA